MLSILHYFSAKSRLREYDKTIYVMGGENKCDPLTLAQREMTNREVEYYLERMKKLGVSLTSIFSMVVVSYTVLVVLYYFFKIEVFKNFF